MLTSGSSQVGTHDNEVDVLQLPCRLELDHNPVSDQEIQAMETYLKPQVENRDRHLPTKWDLARSQLHRQSLLIDRFQKPWTKHSMDRDCRSDHLSGESFMREAHRFRP